jgi:hypothetical protein
MLRMRLLAISKANQDDTHTQGMPVLGDARELVKQVVEVCGWRAGELGEGVVRLIWRRRTSGET